MTVYVAAYNGTDTDDIMGVFYNIEDARKCIHNDYKETKIDYEPSMGVVEDDRIYIADNDTWFDEWYIVETELS